MHPCIPTWAARPVLAACALAFGGSAWAADCVNGVNTADCTVPAGMGSVTIEVWGGGGGGGRAALAGFQLGGGGGGGASHCTAT